MLPIPPIMLCPLRNSLLYINLGVLSIYRPSFYVYFWPCMALEQLNPRSFCLYRFTCIRLCKLSIMFCPISVCVSLCQFAWLFIFYLFFFLHFMLHILHACFNVYISFLFLIDVDMFRCVSRSTVPFICSISISCHSCYLYFCCT